MSSNLPLIYALSMLSYGAARSKEPGAVKAGVVIAENGRQTIRVAKEMAEAFDMSLLAIGMPELRNCGDGVRQVRTMVAATLAEGRPTIFVLDEANDAEGDMLMRTARVIEQTASDSHVVILAVGNHRGNADQIATDIADGMRTHKGMIAGSSTFMEQMGGMFDRVG